MQICWLQECELYVVLSFPLDVKLWEGVGIPTSVTCYMGGVAEIQGEEMFYSRLKIKIHVEWYFV